jgi:hypothetical protein
LYFFGHIDHSLELVRGYYFRNNSTHQNGYFAAHRHGVAGTKK